MKVMEKETIFETVNSRAAGFDIGAEKLFVSADGSTVVNFQTFTADYLRCIAYLKEMKIERVAMEATGVYWIALYEMLEENGIEVCLVNPKEVKQVKGRKTDVKDCQWIQKLYSAGLLRQSYIPAKKLKELRMVVRDREDIIAMGNSYINKMQKALELMNIKLTNVIAQIHGVSGIRMINAIIEGERDPEVLLALCDKRIIKNKGENVKKALEGNYNETYLFLLAENKKMWEQHERHLLVIDKKIESLLNELTEEKPVVVSDAKIKDVRHHKPAVKDLHQQLLNLYGVNASTLSGLTDYSLLRLVGETGNELSRFPTVKHFVSWCQLSPRNSQSGKMNRKLRMKNKSKAGQIFREAAQSLIQSKDIAIGAFMRKIRAKKGSTVAIKAGARKIASAYYWLLTKGNEYVEEGVKKYQAKLKANEFKLLAILANKHHFKLVDNQAA
jgi:transposase